MAITTVKVEGSEALSLVEGIVDGTTNLDTLGDWARGLLATRMLYTLVMKAPKVDKHVSMASARTQFVSQQDQKVADLDLIVQAASILSEADPDWNIQGLVPSPKKANDYIVGGPETVAKSAESAAFRKYFG